VFWKIVPPWQAGANRKELKVLSTDNDPADAGQANTSTALALVEDGVSNATETAAIIDQINAHLRKVEHYETLVDRNKEKREQHKLAVGLLLQDLKKLSPNMWEELAADYCDVRRSRAYELLRIADGKTTDEATRAATAARVRNHRSSKSVTSACNGLAPPARAGDVMVEEPIDPVTVPPVAGNDVNNDESAGKVRAAHAAREPGDPDGLPAVNPAIAAWNATIGALNTLTDEQRVEFDRHIAGLKKRQQLAKALAVVGDPNRNLSSVQIGKYLELLGPELFIQSLTHAPKLWAAVEERLADQKLATSTFTQTGLIKNGTSGMSPKAVGLAADRAEERSKRTASTAEHVA
jgi:hypothetical protein